MNLGLPLIFGSFLFASMVYLPKVAKANLDAKHKLRRPMLAELSGPQVREREIDLCQAIKRGSNKDWRWKAVRLRCADLLPR